MTTRPLHIYVVMKKGEPQIAYDTEDDAEGFEDADDFVGEGGDPGHNPKKKKLRVVKVVHIHNAEWSTIE